MSIELKQLADWHASHACQVRKAAECGTAAENKEPVHGCLLRLADWHDRQSHILRTAIQQAEAKTDEPVAWLYIEDGEVMFGHPNGYRPPDARPLVFGDTHPAPGVPEFSRIAKRKLTDLQEQGFAITGYAIQRGPVRGFIDGGGFVGWWQGEAGPGVLEGFAWPSPPPRRHQSPVLFDDGYEEGWAKCIEAVKAMLAASSQKG